MAVQHLQSTVHLLWQVKGRNTSWVWEVTQVSPGTNITIQGGAVVRALASHQCGPGSNPGVDAICGLSLLLVLPLATKVFFLQVLRFSLLFKNQHLISIRSGAHVHVFKNKLLFYNYSFLSSYKFTITIASLRQQQYIELTTLLKSCKARWVNASDRKRCFNCYHCS